MTPLRRFVALSAAITMLQAAAPFAGGAPAADHHGDHQADRSLARATDAEGDDRPPVRPRAGRVALTFDDGPHPHWTPRLLDLLDRHAVRATFFVVGAYADLYPDIIGDMARRGHSVQNHTWSHASLTSLRSDAAGRQLTRASASIARHTHIEPTCMRPPFMHIDARIRGVAANAGLDVVLWDRDPQEWRTLSVATTVDYLVNRTADGDIILLHDSVGWVVLPVLERVIPALRARGLDFDPICAHPPREVYPRRLTSAGEML
jgi:peptidoglycan-N-acetylglucosamine deacetylase